MSVAVDSGEVMQDQSNSQIIIRHVGGAKVNKIDQFRLDSTEEISFGRDVSASVNYDSPKDDVVSRKHAVIKVKKTDPPSFSLEDLRSSNGTYVNGNRLTGQVDLLPEDTVEFGSGGPKFIFDIQPRPSGLAARTRVMSKFSTTDTQVIGAAAVSETPIVQAVISQTSAAQTPTARNVIPPSQPAKVGVGKNTVQMMLSEERKKTGQTWIGALAAIVTFVGAGGGWLYWNNLKATQHLQQITEENKQRTETEIAQQAKLMGFSPGEIASKFGNAVVVVNCSWRLIDVETGLAVYHQRYCTSDGDCRPAYVKTDDKDDPIRPWFTTYPQQNYPVKGSYQGSGVVVNPQGFILTNRHLVAHWREGFSALDYLGFSTRGWLFDSSGSRSDLDLSSTDPEIKRLKTWKPEEDGGFLYIESQKRFHKWKPLLSNNTRKMFLGRDDILEVLFPGNPAPINATLVRASSDFDAALIKVETPQPLQSVDISADDDVKMGERVVVLGYPVVSNDTMQVVTTENGKLRGEILPLPTVTDGLVARPPTEHVLQGNKEIKAELGEYIQLTAVAAGLGNSGGPVFNADGKLIGLFTGVREYQLGRMSFAIPIKRARDLMAPQKPI
jgi:serine protease Do